MPEVHSAVVLASATTKDWLHAFYTFIGTQTVWEFVPDTGFASAASVSLNGTDYALPTVPGDWGDGGYLVIQNVTAVNGIKYQLKIVRTNTTAMTIQASFDGGWVSKAFPAGSPLTAALAFNTGSAPVASDEFYFSSSDLAGYPYIRCFRKATAAAEDSKFPDSYAMHFGGYKALDTVNDTVPCYLLVRAPRVILNATTLSWGYPTDDVNNMNRAPSNVAHSADTVVKCNLINGLSHYKGAVSAAAHLTEAGAWADPPLMIARSVTTLLGYPDPTYDMRCGLLDRSDGAADNGGTVMVVNDLMLRWAP